MLQPITSLKRLVTLLQKEQTQIRVYYICLLNMIRYDPTLVDLTSYFFVLCTNVKVYLYNYLYRVELLN